MAEGERVREEAVQVRARGAWCRLASLLAIAALAAPTLGCRCSATRQADAAGAGAGGQGHGAPAHGEASIGAEGGRIGVGADEATQGSGKVELAIAATAISADAPPAHHAAALARAASPSDDGDAPMTAAEVAAALQVARPPAQPWPPLTLEDGVALLQRCLPAARKALVPFAAAAEGLDLGRSVDGADAVPLRLRLRPNGLDLDDGDGATGVQLLRGDCQRWLAPSPGAAPMRRPCDDIDAIEAEGLAALLSLRDGLREGDRVLGIGPLPGEAQGPVAPLAITVRLHAIGVTAALVCEREGSFAGLWIDEGSARRRLTLPRAEDGAPAGIHVAGGAWPYRLTPSRATGRWRWAVTATAMPDLGAARQAAKAQRAAQELAGRPCLDVHKTLLRLAPSLRIEAVACRIGTEKAPAGRAEAAAGKRAVAQALWWKLPAAARVDEGSGRQMAPDLEKLLSPEVRAEWTRHFGASPTRVWLVHYGPPAGADDGDGAYVEVRVADDADGATAPPPPQQGEPR